MATDGSKLGFPPGVRFELRPLAAGGCVLTIVKLPSPPAAGLLYRYTFMMFRVLMTVDPKVPLDWKAMNFPLALIDGLRLSVAAVVSVIRVV